MLTYEEYLEALGTTARITRVLLAVIVVWPLTLIDVLLALEGDIG